LQTEINKQFQTLFAERLTLKLHYIDNIVVSSGYYFFVEINEKYLTEN